MHCVGVALDDSCNDAKFNLGLTLLTIGEFEEGWHFYDTRLRLPDKVRSPVSSPMWDGKIDSLGQPLLVWVEQVMETIFSLCVMCRF